MLRLSFLAGFLGLALGLMAQTGTVLFKVSNIQHQKGGELSAGVFNKANFPKVGKQVKGKEKLVDAESMELVLENVPIGKYGAVVFQDIDKNKDLKTNLIGLPIEPIGFANNARIKFGPPAFEEAMIEVLEGKVTVVPIKLK
jgi:uncharacterized protein (DUF2141 family)